MMLEEAILQLLRSAGYSPIEKAGHDPTLRVGSAGMEMIGRGAWHQADAIADFCIVPPFAHQPRLIIEAKCYSPEYPVGLSIIRNAVGVLKDVSEIWITSSASDKSTNKNRYHYQYSVFSASGYTSDAEQYAFAQDIYLITYQKSKYISNVIDSIRSLNYQDFSASAWNSIDIDMKLLRQALRGNIKDSNRPITLNIPQTARDKILDFINAVHRLPWTIFAVIGNRFPLHLIPAQDTTINQIKELHRIKIKWDAQGWYILDSESDRYLFSFDLPPKLFNLYADSGVLTATKALYLKSEMLNHFQAFVIEDFRIRVITFQIDEGWINEVRTRLEEMPPVANNELGE